MKSRLGHYEIVAELGRGGMGVVYKALDPALGRVVAIKELAPTLADDPALVERFLREARAMAALSDPHIIGIHFIGQENGRPFFVMELVEGEALSSVLRRIGQLTVGDALRITQQTARGLATAHEHGVIHRDIKPGNLLIDTRGRVRIADFGIALPTRDLATKLTGTGEFIGTPGYVCPEICKGQPVDARSDIFSLGVVLFEMLTGRMPFTDLSPLGLMLEVVNAQIPDIQALNHDVDAGASAILSRMVAKDPGERYQTAAELVQALSAHPLTSEQRPLSLQVIPPRDSDTAAFALLQPRVPTPPPIVSLPGTTAPEPTAANVDASTARRPAHSAPAQPATVARPKPSRSPIARDRYVAALVIGLLLLGGTAYAFRDYLSGFANGFRDGFVAGKVSNPVGATQAANDQPAGASALTTPVATTAAPATTEPATTVPATAASVSVDSAATSAAATSPPAVATTATPALPATEPTTTAPTAAPSTAAAGTPATAAAPANSAQAPAIASRTPAPPRAAPPSPPPRVTVVALGDPALSIPAQQQLEEYLGGAGYALADAETIPGMGRGDVVAMLRAAARHARVVVIVRAQPAGSRDLSYYGRHSVAYTAWLSARAYDVASGQPLGAGFRKKVEFAELNAELKAAEALGPELGRIERALAPALRRGDRS